jgi:hypothetical protein
MTYYNDYYDDSYDCEPPNSEMDYLSSDEGLEDIREVMREIAREKGTNSPEYLRTLSNYREILHYRKHNR